MPTEYGPANEKMRTLLYTARSYNKNLVLTHYPKDIYAERLQGEKIVSYTTGEQVPDGFKETQRLADIIIKLEMKLVKVAGAVDEYKAIATITKSGMEGLGSSVVGLTIAPNYQGLVDLASTLGAELEPERA